MIVVAAHLLMLAPGLLALSVLALDLLVLPCWQLVLGTVGAGRYHLAVAAVLVAPLLKLASGLSVLWVLTLEL